MYGRKIGTSGTKIRFISIEKMEQKSKVSNETSPFPQKSCIDDVSRNLLRFLLNLSRILSMSINVIVIVIPRSLLHKNLEACRWSKARYLYAVITRVYESAFKNKSKTVFNRAFQSRHGTTTRGYSRGKKNVMSVALKMEQSVAPCLFFFYRIYLQRCRPLEIPSEFMNFLRA